MKFNLQRHCTNQRNSFRNTADETLNSHNQVQTEIRAFSYHFLAVKINLKIFTDPGRYYFVAVDFHLSAKGFKISALSWCCASPNDIIFIIPQSIRILSREGRLENALKENAKDV